MEFNIEAPAGFKPPSDMARYAPDAYKGDSPPHQDIIAGRLPRGKVVVLAGEGDVGKSWQMLELHRALNDGASDYAFGGRIVQRGLPCIYLSGEDDFSTLDNRLRTIRRANGTPPPEHGLLIPAPDLGQMQLVNVDFLGTVQPTEVYAWLDLQLDAQRAAFGDLGFVGIDTFSTFFPVDANNNASVQACLGLMTRLATKHDVCILILHHVSKGSDHGTRAAIRGATAIVDGARAAYTLFKANENDKDFVHKKLEGT